MSSQTCRIEIDKLLGHEHVFVVIEGGRDRPNSGGRSGPKLLHESHRFESGESSVPESAHLLAMLRGEAARHEMVLRVGEVLSVLKIVLHLIISMHFLGPIVSQDDAGALYNMLFPALVSC